MQCNECAGCIHIHMPVLIPIPVPIHILDFILFIGGRRSMAATDIGGRTARSKPLDKCLFNPFSQQLRVAVSYISRQRGKKNSAERKNNGKWPKLCININPCMTNLCAPQNCQPPVHLAFCLILMAKWHTFKFGPFSLGLGWLTYCAKC